MSDYVTGLRADLVEAAERRRRHGALGRAARPLHPRAWSRGGALGAAALAVAAIAFVVAVIALAPRPAERAARSRVVATIAVGGAPQGAAFGAGALWVADFDGSLVRVDPSTGRVVRRIAVGGQPEAVGVGGRDVWVRLAAGSTSSGGVVRVDAASGRITARVRVGDGEGIAVGARSVWVTHRFDTAEGVDRIDRARARLAGRIGIRSARAAVEAGGVLWVAVQEGTIVQVDASSSRVIRRWPALAPSVGAPTGLLADARGLWIVSGTRGELLRLEDGKVARRYPVTLASQKQPLLARTRGGLWLASGTTDTSLRRSPNVVQRIDPATGRVTARVAIGDQRPVALVPVGADLAVVTAQGRVLVVGG